MDGVTDVQAVQEGLTYIADCLEEGQLYSVSIDEFITGEEMHERLVDFARKLASGKTLEQWKKWIALRDKAK